MTTANARARRRGKDHERRLAKATGGKRSGNLGRAAADVISGDGWLCIEGKAWTTPPRRVEAALEQAERAAGPDQLPVAVIHTAGRRSANDLVVMRWGQFVDWFGGTAEPAMRSEFVGRMRAEAASGDAEAERALRILAPDARI